MIKVELFELEEAPLEEIESFLLQIPHTLLYVSPSYLKLLKGYLNCEILLIVAFSEGKINGLLPLAFKNNKDYGTVCNSLPFYGSNGGIIILDNDYAADIQKAVLKFANELIISKNCIATTIISNPLDQNGNKFLKDNFAYDLVDERIGQISHLPIKSNTEYQSELLKRFEDPRPRNIRKAIKEGVKVYYSNAKEDLSFLFKVHYDNITAINGIAKEESFFSCIPNYFSNSQFRVYIAEYNGQKIGALLLFYFNKTVEYFTPAVIEEFRGLQPTSLLIYQSMLDAIQDGYLNWNWGGTWLSQGGVYDFKKKWGTTDYRYFYYTSIRDKSILNNNRSFFLNEYPYFFVVPFNALKS